MAPESDIVNRIRAKALELGFSACGFSPVCQMEEFRPVFDDWLSKGYAGEMDYLSQNRDLRTNPGLLVPVAKTIISLAAGYYFPDEGSTVPVSRYARGKDYHKVLKKLGKELLAWINREVAPANGRVFCDTAPIFEKEWARRSGLGWIGKNGLLLIPGKGSWFFLCEVVTSLEIIEQTEMVPDQCGTCSRCMDACPTGAITEPGRIDPRACISYLTVEQKTEIPDSFKGKWNQTVHGCDICQSVCPWNREPIATGIRAFKPEQKVLDLTIDAIPELSPESFSELFDRTPVKRIGLSGILRNFAFLAK
ncbi:MAG: tRNA epoxyqueuosine(34) reductase QueG [Bacteroidetes bacterium GWF2_49_14]|nr:MAG: tRNA epoxyqueuosine(34) reductase QueG [Bacteroidetes bacterium GWF2_49_14]HBB93446.1 tRNA epoxyqueuosine(34) reductase QueG [Bacteroidales bacterium]